MTRKRHQDICKKVFPEREFFQHYKKAYSLHVEHETLCCYANEIEIDLLLCPCVVFLVPLYHLPLYIPYSYPSPHTHSFPILSPSVIGQDQKLEYSIKISTYVTFCLVYILRTNILRKEIYMCCEQLVFPCIFLLFSIYFHCNRSVPAARCFQNIETSNVKVINGYFDTN